MRADNIIAQEKLADIALNDLFQKDHTFFSVFSFRKFHNPWQDRRHLHRCKIQCLMLFLVVFSADQGTDIQGLVADQWKRSGRIHRHRCQNWIDIFLKISIHKFFLLFAQTLVLGNNFQPPLFQSRDQRSIVSRILQIYQFVCLF